MYIIEFVLWLSALVDVACLHCPPTTIDNESDLTNVQLNLLKMCLSARLACRKSYDVLTCGGLQRLSPPTWRRDIRRQPRARATCAGRYPSYEHQTSSLYCILACDRIIVPICAALNLNLGNPWADACQSSPATMNDHRPSTLSPRRLVEKTRLRLQALPSFQESVDENNRVDIDYRANPWWKTRYLCWEVKGAIAEEYRSLGPKIREALQNSCRESSFEVFVWPYMVGKSTKTARPVLIIASEDEASREDAKVAIETSGLLQTHRYFKLWPLRYLPTGPINPVAMESQAPAQPLQSFEVFYDPAKPIIATGMPIFLRAGNGSLRLATANAVHTGTELGYLTAAHAFSETEIAATPPTEPQTSFDFPWNTDSESGSESEGSDIACPEAWSIYSGTSPEATRTESASVSTSRSSRSSTNGNAKAYGDLPEGISATSAAPALLATSSIGLVGLPPEAGLELLGLATVSNDEFDIAVIVVTNSLVQTTFEHLMCAEIPRESVCISRVRRANATAMTCRGPVQGSIVDLPLFMRPGQSGSVQTLFMFTHDERILKGDCGSLVVDHNTNEVYGHIVAGSLRRGASLLMPARPVFEKLEHQGNWKLLTLDNGNASSKDVTSHTGSGFLSDNTKPAEFTDLPPNTEWQDLVAWDDDLELRSPSMDWDFMRSQPRDIIRPTGNDPLALRDDPSSAFVSGEQHYMMSIPPPTMESLSSRGSVAWSLDSPTHGMTAPSSLGDIDEFDRFEHLSIENEADKAATQSGTSASSRAYPDANLSGSRTRRRRMQPTHSPASDFGWVSYQMDTNTNRLVPKAPEGMQGRSPRGRKKGLTAAQRTHAALMRMVGACSNCMKRKEKCDPGVPCKACLEHYKADLVHHPCRDRRLSDSFDVSLAKIIGWHPRPASSIGLDEVVHMKHETPVYYIPVYIGFGSSIRLAVHGLGHGESNITHTHGFYGWPPAASDYKQVTQLVLPAMLTPDTAKTLQNLLDEHLTSLVLKEFRQFPLYVSPLRVLREVYVFFRSLTHGSDTFELILKALKLLVLVHISGDITVPESTTDAGLELLVRTTMDTHESAQLLVPCFIRAQVGSTLGSMGAQLMKEVLSSLEILLVARDCDDWPAILATLLVVLMAVESIQYHSAKKPYHDSNAPPEAEAQDSKDLFEASAKTLLAFYMACFGGCHVRLKPDWEGEQEPGHGGLAASAEEIFISCIRKAMRLAAGGGYLSNKVNDRKWDGQDMNFFFDRLIAHLLIGKVP